MGRAVRNNLWVVWLSAVIFILPLSIKTLHCYAEHHRMIPGDLASHHDCDSCFICNFAYDIFKQPDLISYDFSLEPSYFKYSAVCEDIAFRGIILCYGLRAPPVS